MTKYFAALLMFFVAWPSFAADVNGYMAKYECRAGGQYCNVDVAALGKRACDQTIAASTPWSSINWSSNTICLEAGDHTSKGTLTIPSSASGKLGNYKVLRYYRTGDSDDEPWNQSTADKARISKIEIVGADYWIIHRLSFPSLDTGGNRIFLSDGTETNIIINRVLVEGTQSGFSNAYTGIKATCCSSSNVTIQNSVIRNSVGTLGAEPHGVTPEDGTDMRIVNNEVYNWSAHPIQMGRNGTPVMPGFIIENNDIYQTSAMHLPNGKASAKNTLSIKAGGISTNPGKVIHNRIWGSRNSDTSACCINSDAGAGVYNSSGGGHQYVLIQDNIVTDSQQGYAALNCSNGCSLTSLIGNIFYNIKRFADSGAYALNTVDLSTSEIYLNTIISNPVDGAIRVSGGSDKDVRCNVIIDAVNLTGTPSTGTEVNNNAYYGVAGTKIETTKINKTLNTLSGSFCTTLGCTSAADTTGYLVGDIVRTSTDPVNTCTGVADTDCFLYKVVTAGSSGSIKAVRGPFSFYRKLRTKPELAIIPYAIPYTDPNDQASSPDAHTCPSNYAARSGIGINNAN